MASPAIPNEPAFWIESVQSGHSRSRNTRTEIALIHFQPLEEQQRPDLLMERLVEQMFERVVGNRPPPIYISLQLHPPSFEHPFTVPLRPPTQNNAAAIAAAIERLNEQSGAQIDLLAGGTMVKVVAVWPLGANRTDEEEENQHQGNFFLLFIKIWHFFFANFFIFHSSHLM